jgi:hypothetical protein
VAEWLKAHAWKACIGQLIEGSNPFLSAERLKTSKTLCFSGFFIEIPIQNIDFFVNNYNFQNGNKQSQTPIKLDFGIFCIYHYRNDGFK